MGVGIQRWRLVTTTGAGFIRQEEPFVGTRVFAQRYLRLLREWYTKRPGEWKYRVVRVDLEGLPPEMVISGSTKTLMACGCIATGSDVQTGKAVCIVHVGLDPGACQPKAVTTHAFLDRLALCDYCKKPAPSGPELPFFTFSYRYPPADVEILTPLWSRMMEIDSLHRTMRIWPGQQKGAEYRRLEEERGQVGKRWALLRKDAETRKFLDPLKPDSYYCGCRGWD